MRDAFPIVATFGERLRTQKHGWMNAKALIVLTAQSGCWDGAAALADALGVSPDAQEGIYREVYGHNPPPRHPVSEPGTPRQETHHEPHTTAEQHARLRGLRDDQPRQAAG